ncbi:MAG: NAD(P)/FAD-dependent oxidoreductase [Caldisericaceae bacterium]
MENYDVVIVGAGISGLSTAYYLGKSGVKKVLLLDKSYIGAGSTGRCGTGIRQQFTTREHIVLMRESVKLWQEWEESLPYPIHFRQGGYLWLLRSQEEAEQYKEYVKLQNLLGVGSMIISALDAKAIVPELNIEGIYGASWCPTDGNAYPQDVLIGLEKAVKQMGIEIRTYESVEDIKIKNNVVGEVVTDKQTYGAGIVLNASGNFSKLLGRMVGVELPLENFRHQIAVSEPLKIFLSPMVVKGDLYFTQTYRGRIIGGTDTGGNPTESLLSTVSFIEQYASELVSTMPLLSSVKFMRQWAGFYVVSPDHHPIIGPTGVSNFIVATGYSGHGFMLGPIIGKLIAGYIRDGSFFLPEANNLTLERFSTGKLIQERAVIG